MQTEGGSCGLTVSGWVLGAGVVCIGAALLTSFRLGARQSRRRSSSTNSSSSSSSAQQDEHLAELHELLHRRTTEIYVLKNRVAQMRRHEKQALLPDREKEDAQE
jgi:HAMP domain-containing protein